MLAWSPQAAAPQSLYGALDSALAERANLADPGAPIPGTTARDRSAGLVIAAMNFIGVRYRNGGSDAGAGFDCSGFTRHIFALSLGLLLPRSADEQATARGLIPVEKADLQSGDLVFFNTLQRSFSHVGIYIGEGRFIHAPRSGSDVRIEDMRYAYWAERYTGARRAGTPEAPAAARAALLPTRD